MSMSTVHHHHHHHTRAHAQWGGGVDTPQRSERAEARGERRDDAASRPGRDTETPAYRGNPLVGAMMKALQGLVAPPAAGGSTATPPPQAEPGAATPANPAAAGSDGAGELREAAYAFANELFGALRGAGRERGDDRERQQGHGHDGHGRHHHGWHRGGRQDDAAGRFDGLVGRLQSLARTLGSSLEPAAARPATPLPASAATAASASSDLPTATASTGADPALPAAAAAPGNMPVSPTAADGRIGISLTITVQLDLGQAGAAAPPRTDQASPLLAAFQQLMDRLSPNTADSTATPSDTAARLKTFLLDMATALSASGQGNAGLKPPVGGLVNLSA